MNKVNLMEWLEHHPDDEAWEMDLCEAIDDEDWDNLYESARDKTSYSVGDILMLDTGMKNIGHPIKPHRIFVINAVKEDDKTTYGGFIMSSSIGYSNKNNKRYPNNIYISDYSTIIEEGPKPHKEAYINLDQLQEFTSDELGSGHYKGHTTDEFINFIKNCLNNKDNSKVFWDKE